MTTEQASSPGGASSVEVYGFAGWITSAVAYVIFLFWAYLPEEYLHAFGVTYYPNKHWAITIPVWILLLILYVYWVYESLNMMTVHPFSSVFTLHDERSKWASNLGLASVVGPTELSIPPLLHVPAPVVSRVLYCGHSVREAEAAECHWQAQADSAAPTASGPGATKLPVTLSPAKKIQKRKGKSSGAKA